MRWLQHAGHGTLGHIGWIQEPGFRADGIRIQGVDGLFSLALHLIKAACMKEMSRGTGCPPAGQTQIR
jgi:hypothetical protein